MIDFKTKSLNSERVTGLWTKTSDSKLWNWSLVSEIDFTCKLEGGPIEPPGRDNESTCDTIGTDQGIWKTVSFVEGENYVKMVAKRSLLNKNEIVGLDNWAVADNINYVAAFDFKGTEGFSGRSDFQLMTLNHKGNMFWNLNGFLDLQDEQALVVAILLFLFCFFYICGLIGFCRARSLSITFHKLPKKELS
jgi:hypothetical protein